MKIDLHLHTPSSKINGDSINWTSEIDSARRVLTNKVGAISFTDHNCFNSELFLKTKKVCGSKLYVFPGVEINILKDTGIVAHILLIFNNELPNNELKKLEMVCKNNLKKRGISIDKVYELFKDYEFIAIPHVGKGDYFEPKELTFDHDAIEITSYKNRNYKKWLKELNNKSVVAFSDTHIWKDYPQNQTLETFVEFDGTFSDLKIQLNKNKNYTREK